MSDYNPLGTRYQRSRSCIYRFTWADGPGWYGVAPLALHGMHSTYTAVLLGSFYFPVLAGILFVSVLTFRVSEHNNY